MGYCRIREPTHKKDKQVMSILFSTISEETSQELAVEKWQCVSPPKGENSIFGEKVVESLHG